MYHILWEEPGEHQHIVYIKDILTIRIYQFVWGHQFGLCEQNQEYSAIDNNKA